MNNVSPDFKNYGGAYLISDKNYELHIDGNSEIGRSDGQFMIPSNQMDELLSNYPNGPREWERQLGLDSGSLGNEDIRRVDVYNPQDYDPRLPTSDLSGANDKFIEGGKTPGGQDEGVINSFPNPETNHEVGKISNLSSQTNEQSNGTLPTEKSPEEFDPLKSINNSNEAVKDGLDNATDTAKKGAEDAASAVNPANFSM